MRDTKNSKFGSSNKYGDNKMGLGSSNGHDNQSENQKKPNDDAIQDPFKANYDELQQVYGFLTENKYVIEAIFENVLLENNLYKFPLSVISDTERKQLMEKLMSNDEFKEYVYQKIIRGQDITKEDTVEPAKREHLVSQAATQADGANMSVQYSSIINADVATKEAK